LDAAQGFTLMQQAFRDADCKMPVLFKQYAGLYEAGGYEAIDFSVDVDFGDCVDGLFVGDLHRLKPAKRARYFGAAESPAVCVPA
jgi:hypothetical protein